MNVYYCYLCAYTVVCLNKEIEMFIQLMLRYFAKAAIYRFTANFYLHKKQEYFRHNVGHTLFFWIVMRGSKNNANKTTSNALFSILNRFTKVLTQTRAAFYILTASAFWYIPFSNVFCQNIISCELKVLFLIRPEWLHKSGPLLSLYGWLIYI